jgi:hypothetical protein
MSQTRQRRFDYPVGVSDAFLGNRLDTVHELLRGQCLVFV